MTYRILRDPHSYDYEWRVAAGRREVRWNGGTRYGHGQWYAGPYQWVVFEHTPERIALWADLMLQPFE